MKLVIIESPYKGDVERNMAYLRACIRDCVFNRNDSPYASHRMLTDALDDNDPKERQIGIEAGLEWGRAGVVELYPNGGVRLDVVKHVFYIDLGWTDGMHFAVARCEKEKRPYETRVLPPDLGHAFIEEYGPFAPVCVKCGRIRYSEECGCEYPKESL